MEKKYFIFEQVKKISMSPFTINYSNFNPKIITKLSKIWVGIGDPDKPIPDPGSQRHQFTDPLPQH
jgi:hypothetical protein